MNFEQWCLGFMTIEEFQALDEAATAALQKVYKKLNPEEGTDDATADQGAAADMPAAGQQAAAGATAGQAAAAAGATNLNATATAGVQATAAVDVRAQIRREAAAEIARQNAIRRICANEPNLETEVNGRRVNVLQHAIEAGWTQQQTELVVLRASRQSGPFGYAVSGPSPTTAQTIEAAIAIHGGLENLDRHFPEQALDAAHRQYRRGIGLKQLLLEAAWQGGYTGRHFDTGGAGLKSILRAAFSSLSLPGILSNNANKFLLEGYSHVESAWQEISARRSVSDFKTVTSYRMTGAFQFEEVGPSGELKHGDVDELSYTNQAKTYGRMFSITRQDIINDDLGAMTVIPRRIGRGAALKLNDVFWTAFLDNSDFFKTGNNNFFSGAATTLQSSSLTTALQKFRDQTDADGKPLGVEPNTLLVPTALEVTALELHQSTAFNTGGAATDTRVPNKNIWAGRFAPVVSTYLGNTAYTGASSVAWYLLANPMDVAVIEVCFLNGVESPTVEEADADFNVLGVQMRGYFDFGVSKQDFRGGVKSKGAA